MAAFLFLALTFAPFFTPLVMVWAAVMLIRRAGTRLPHGERRRLPSGATCAWAAVLGGAAAFGAYAWGVMSGFYILDPDQMCAARGVQGDHVVTRMTLPVSSQCVTSGGVGSELVPVWVNPVIFLGLALFVLALVAGIVSAVRTTERHGT